MKETIKYIAKLSASATFTYIKISLLGAFSTIAAFIIELFVFGNQINVGASGHVSAIPFVVLAFATRPVGTILATLSLVVSPFLLFYLGNQYIVSKVIHKVIKEKAETWIQPVFDKVLSKIQEKQPIAMRNAGDFSMEKLKLIHSVNAENENKWLKRILVYGLKRINMDDVDFNEEGQNFYKIIKLKTFQKLEEVTEPSKMYIWILLTLQWVFVLIVWLTKW